MTASAKRKDGGLGLSCSRAGGVSSVLILTLDGAVFCDYFDKVF
jgi:hypothetical protein